MSRSFVRQVSIVLILLQIGNMISGCRHTENPEKLIRFNHIEDLTYTLTAEFPYIHVGHLTFPFSMIPMATIPRNGVAANSWHIHEHLGTHIDAPNHFDEQGMSVDQIKPEDLIVPVVVIDITRKASLNKDAEVTLEDIQGFEDKYGRIPDKACVMMLSGWEKFVHDERAYLGLDSQGVKHFPGFSPAAADFLVKKRDIAGLGVDVISFDPGRDENYSTHKVLLHQGRWAIENIANLGKIPVTGAMLIVGAPKIGKATGGTARIFALW